MGISFEVRENKLSPFLCSPNCSRDASLFVLGDKFPLKEEGLKGSGRVNCFLIFGEIDSDQVYAVQFLSVAQIPSLCSSSKLLSARNIFSVEETGSSSFPRVDYHYDTQIGEEIDACPGLSVI